MAERRSNSFFGKRLAGLTALLVVFDSSSRASELNKNNGIMWPNKPQQIVNAGANVTVTCIFIHSADIKWIYPDYLSKTPEVSGKKAPRHFGGGDSVFKNQFFNNLADQLERQTTELRLRKERDSRFVDYDPVECQDERHGLLRVLPAAVRRTARQTISLRLQ